jgi:signal transduction histidine kinase
MELEKRNCELKLSLNRYKQTEKELSAKLKLLQRELIRSERLAATGRLALSIAHEVNSPLQSIAFILEIIQKNSFHDKGFAEKIDLLKSTFGDMRRTVKKLLDLNRPWRDEKQETNINHLLIKTTDLFRIQLKRSGVKLNLLLSPRIPNIIALPHQLSHVFLNLLNNANDAMTDLPGSDPDGTVRHDHYEIIVRSSSRNGNVVINVADNGPGIPEEEVEHIFDPFFTRKKEVGMGIGLSVSRDFIKNHGGTIRAENSSPESGAVFTIELPYHR